MRTIRYGPSDAQEAELHLPAAPDPPVVCLLHGGFWRMPYGRDEMAAVAGDLVARGFAVWNLEYRRLGAPDASWPATLDDVAAGIDHLARLRADGADLDLDRVSAVGHSAGGHLALWAAGRRRTRPDRAPRVHVRAVVALAPVADLAYAHEVGLGRGAVAELLGGSSVTFSGRLRTASPMELLPLGARQLILHGAADDVVPVEVSRRYARAAAGAGDEVELVELPGTGHMEFLDPSSAAHAIVRAWLLANAGRRGAPSLRPTSPCIEAT